MIHILNQSSCGVDINKYNQNSIHKRPIKLMINKPLFNSNLFLNTSNADIINKFIDNDIGKIKTPNPILPPESFIIINVNLRKYTRFNNIIKVPIIF